MEPVDFQQVSKIILSIKDLLAVTFELKTQLITSRSSRPEVFSGTNVLTNLANITEKHMCHSLFLIKLQASGLQHY